MLLKLTAIFQNVSKSDGVKSAISQAISSINTFGITYYLLRNIPQIDFGLFSIGLSFTFFIAGFYQGFFVTQYIVLSPHEDTGSFSSEVLTLLLLSLSGGFGIAFMAAAFLEFTYNLGLFTFSVFLAAAVASLKEFFIRYAFATGRGNRALAMQMVQSGALVLLVGIVEILDLPLGADAGLLTFALALAACAATGYVGMGLRIHDHCRNDLARSFRKLRIGGQWTIVSNLIYGLRGNAQIIVISATLGAAAVAKVNAARLFLTPPILLLPALSAVILPRFALALHHEGHEALRSVQRRSGVLLMAITLAYSAVLLIFWELLEHRILGAAYHGSMPLVAAWGLYAIALAARSSTEWSAQAQRRFPTLTKVSGLTAVVAISLAWLLTEAHGPAGAILAMAIAELFMAISVWGTIGLRRKGEQA